MSFSKISKSKILKEYNIVEIYDSDRIMIDHMQIKCSKDTKFVKIQKKTGTSQAPDWFLDFIKNQFNPLVEMVMQNQKLLLEHDKLLREHNWLFKQHGWK